ncbi:hypothetical protein GCM10009654_29380 [Streptomyces hebeiensis]|uniref:Uncharacterized protein n=1 Tax=Streptomyces hebeiensis TaxID=229486 RepID=A0ABP4FG82_9ACTN
MALRAPASRNADVLVVVVAVTDEDAALAVDVVMVIRIWICPRVESAGTSGDAPVDLQPDLRSKARGRARVPGHPDRRQPWRNLPAGPSRPSN